MKKKVFLFFLLGVIVGLVNGFFGGGGGVICVPFLKILLELDDKKAHATTVFIMSIISIATLFVYITTISVSSSILIFVSLGVFIGGLIGASLLKNLKNEIINAIFILILLTAGIKMLL